VSWKSWPSLWVLIIVGRLLFDVGTPRLPGAFQFDGDQSAESRVARAQRAPAPAANRPQRPTLDPMPFAASTRLTSPRPTAPAHVIAISGPRRLPGLDRDPAPASDDH
jgi:hypothetical protein